MLPGMELTEGIASAYAHTRAGQEPVTQRVKWLTAHRPGHARTVCKLIPQPTTNRTSGVVVVAATCIPTSRPAPSGQAPVVTLALPLSFPRKYLV